MPTRPLSHAQRQSRALSDRAYDRTTRQASPALAQAKQVRSSARWRRVRALVLSAAPLCADVYGVHAAAGRIVVATQVDHIVPLIEAPTLAYDASNLQPLCDHCHGRKSGLERRVERETREGRCETHPGGRGEPVA